MGTRSDLIRALERSGIGYTELAAGPCWALVVPALAARILGAGVGDENALWTAQAFTRSAWEAGGNAGGLRTWIAPELGPHGFFGPGVQAWRVPADLDPGAYAEWPAPDGWRAWRTELDARTADGETHRIAVTREVSVEAAGGATTPELRMRFRHRLENRGSTVIDRRVGLWCIVQVPSDRAGTIVIPVRDASGAPRPYFEKLPPGALRSAAGTFLLQTGGGRRYKVGVPATQARGGIGFLGRSRTGTGRIVVCLRLAVDPAGTYLDRPPDARGPGDALQAYNDPGVGSLAFSEIEAHAPAATLAPGEEQAADVLMTVAAGGEARVLEVASRVLEAQIDGSLLPA